MFSYLVITQWKYSGNLALLQHWCNIVSKRQPAFKLCQCSQQCLYSNLVLTPHLVVLLLWSPGWGTVPFIWKASSAFLQFSGHWHFWRAPVSCLDSVPHFYLSDWLPMMNSPLAFLARMLLSDAVSFWLSHQESPVVNVSHYWWC